MVLARGLVLFVLLNVAPSAYAHPMKSPSLELNLEVGRVNLRLWYVESSELVQPLAHIRLCSYFLYGSPHSSPCLFARLRAQTHWHLLPAHGMRDVLTDSLLLRLLIRRSQ